MWSRSRLWNGSAVARLMDARGARGLLRDTEWAFSLKAWLTGRPSCQRRENKVHPNWWFPSQNCWDSSCQSVLQICSWSGCKAEKRGSCLRIENIWNISYSPIVRLASALSRAQHVEPKCSAPVLEESLKNPSRHSKIQNAAKGFKMVEMSPSEAESRETICKWPGASSS